MHKRNTFYIYIEYFFIQAPIITHQLFQSLILVMESSSETGVQLPVAKKAIVVVGKMGHGKSSFVKMLASDSDKDNIDARTHIKSVTSKCSLCKVNPVHNLLEDLYIVDTPGLDSENFDVFYILEKLNQFILIERLQIVSLCYVLNIKAGRQEKQNGKGCIFTFFQHLKLRYSIKKQIMVCILTHFDEYYNRTQGNQKHFHLYQECFERQGLEQIWKRKIEWMSEPSEDVQNFNDITRDKGHKAHKIWLDQWEKLKKQVKLGKFINFEEYKKDMEDYGRLLFKKMGNVLDNNKGVSIQQITRQLTIEEKSEGAIASLGFGAGLGVGAFIGSIVTATTFAASEAVIAGVVIASSAAGPIGLCVVGGVLAIGFISFGVYKLLKKNFNGKQDKWKAQEYQLLWKQLKQFQIGESQTCTGIQGSTLFVNMSSWIENVEGQMIEKEKTTKLSFKVNDNRRQAKICAGTLKLTYHVKTPTLEAYGEFSKDIVKEFYGNI